MNMLGNIKNTIRIFAVGGLLAAPSVAIGGNYGTAGVADANVGQFAARTGVWCPALEANVPENLFSQMDCGAQNVARSAVAGERITNRSRGLFGIFAPHEPRGGREPQRDDDNTTPTSPTPTVASADPTSPTTPETPSDSDPTPNEKVSKWDRMDDFGLNEDNWSDQSTDFHRQVNDYRTGDGFDDDWSDFNPTLDSSSQ